MTAGVSVVVATRNRRPELLRTLARLRGLPERPSVIVVDNGSGDGTVSAVTAGFPDVRVVPLGRNRGAVARNIGVHLARTPYVAFSDDDSWWEPGALTLACVILGAHPRVGLIAARTVVGPDRVPDPLNAVMADTPLDGGQGLPGRSVLGFLGCASVVRRRAFLDAGGFSEVLFFAGEERLLAYDLAARGWALRYVPEVVAVHEPSPHRPPKRTRLRVERRNSLLTAWMRRPGPVAVRETVRLGTRAVRDGDCRAALLAAAWRMPGALMRRRTLPPAVERDIRRLGG